MDFRTFSEFEEATTSQLKAAAKTSFEMAKTGPYERMSAGMLQAQFYISEIERRDSASIARRDFRMELIVIALIALELAVAGWGIWLGSTEAAEQSRVSQKQIEMLDKLQKAMMRAGNMNLIR